jgi:hypothetical protein
MVETKLLNVSTRSSESGNDTSLLEIKEEELWVGSGYLSNEGETTCRSDLMSHKNVHLPSCFSPKSYERERRERGRWEEKVSFGLPGF